MKLWKKPNQIKKYLSDNGWQLFQIIIQNNHLSDS